MRALVIYESMFGNTAVVARAIGRGLARQAEVTVLEVSSAPVGIGPDVDLVVVGGPTHALSMTSPKTRDSAVEQGAEPVEVGLREWIAHLDPGTARPLVAAFDTRIKVPLLAGSAARAVLRRLRRRHLRALAPATNFWVAGTKGPLVEGEEARAEAWGSELASRMPALSR